VETVGTRRDALRLNLWLRTGHRVLLRLRTFRAETGDDLYDEVRRVAWEDHLPPDGFVQVGGDVHTESMRDTLYPLLKCKDAIVDRLREVCGRRPDTGAQGEGAAVFLYWEGREAALYLDTTGTPLNRRGYRIEGGEAPLSESLAAGMILIMGWTPDRPLLNPMCGSGTLAIEAALLAARRPPGAARERFAFHHEKGFTDAEWDHARAQADRLALPVPDPPKILASDIDPAAVARARRNAERAGVAGWIDFSVCDFRETPVPPEPGAVVLNPEYGERLGRDDDLAAHYRDIGRFLAGRCAGWDAWVVSSNRGALDAVGLPVRERRPVFNGALACDFRRYKT
jgi:putative N6-adenine-specific DNA methylase